MSERKPSREARTFEFAGALSGIGGLILLFTGFALEFEWISGAAKIVGLIGLVAGLSLCAVGNLIRDWD